MPQKRKGNQWIRNKAKRIKTAGNAESPNIASEEHKIPLASRGTNDKEEGQNTRNLRNVLYSGIVRGTRSQNSRRYGANSRGNQCTAIAAVAIAYEKLIPYNAWNSNVVDNILDHGDELYRLSIDARNPQNSSSVHLYPIEIYPNLIIDNVSFSLQILETETITGHIDNPLTNDTDINIALAIGLPQLFQHYESAIFTSGLLSISVSKSNNYYYLFDSHSRSANGERIIPTGKACLLQFNTVERITRFLLRTYNRNELYTLVPVEITFTTIDNVNTVNNAVTLDNINSVYNGNVEENHHRGSAPKTRTKATAAKKTTKKPSTPTTPHYLGKMDQICPHCYALFFLNEAFLCCDKGKIQIPSNSVYPDLLKALITDVHPYSKEFTKNIRRYNTLLALGSTKYQERENLGPGAPVIVVSGQIHHRVGDIDPTEPKFGSLYFVDSGEATTIRMAQKCSKKCNEQLMRQLDEMLREIHPYAKMYCTLREVVQEFQKNNSNSTVQELGLYFHYQPGTDRKVHEAPSTSNEIGAVFRSLDGNIPPMGAIRVHIIDRNPQNPNYHFKDIPRLSPIADTLCYPLIFPKGELGWSINLKKVASARRITMREYECYRIMIRPDRFNAILFCAKLTQQFIVDKYAQVEGDRLYYLRTHQTKLRAENYAGIQDYVANKVASSDKEKIGKVVILPSTFSGGMRFMTQNYQDAMAIVAKFGRPSLFITFTCNPNWSEIKENLNSKILNPQDRPELIARVFEMKRKAFFEDVLRLKLFGEVVAFVYVIEFQKRGLPHMHCLLFLSDTDKLRNPEDVDRFISAELPEENTRLFDIILSTMIHGPCGDRNPKSPCMIEGKCSKQYPKSFVSETSINKAWPEYRRRDNGRTAIFMKNKIGCIVDNRDVVPYNPYLSLKYGSHINVEVVTSVGSIKYIFKYINKGPDAAVIQVRDEVVFDEIKAFIESRYISSGEAAWRLFSFSIQGKSHTIYRLPVHLPGERVVYFEEGQEETALQQPKESLLEAYFRLNAQDTEACKLTYTNIPLHYSYNPKQKRWVKRVRNRQVIPRMYTISPKYVEKFHLRILLLHVPGAKSFEDLRTFNGITYSTFRESVQARGLIATDVEWVKTLEHAALVQMPGCMRKLFAYMLCFCEISDPMNLWDTFKRFMYEDFLKRGYSEEQSENTALCRIDSTLRFLGRRLKDFNMPEPNSDIEIASGDADDQNDGVIVQNSSSATLNLEQRDVFDRVIAAVQARTIEERLFFVQGNGGCGKTFLYNVIIDYCETHNLPFIAVAFTGIAALLLRSGRTVHSTFKLPLDVNEDTRSSITAQSEEADRLRSLELIIWDEVSMSSYHVINAVDELFRDVCNDQRPFGGKCILLGGDVKQLLPVAPGRVHQVELFFTNCKSWKNFKVLTLNTNMRVFAEQIDFMRWLEDLGQGTINIKINAKDRTSDDFVQLPERCLTTNVIHEIYGQLKNLTQEELAMRAILSPRNDHCNYLNDKIIEMFPGDAIVSRSVDSIASGDEDEIANFPEEYLNSITPSGLPLHELKLKVGIPIILLRNMCLEDGLINGTRLLVLAVTDVLITAKIITGRFAGRISLIPKLDLTSADKNLPFVMKRHQFPIKVCFALTINKAQGQTFDQVGIYLGTPVFSHGQLYVAFSRARSWDAVKVEVVHGKDQDWE